LCFKPTGSPQLSQSVGRTALNVPQLWHSVSPGVSGSTLTSEPQDLQFARR
jgi:hypothetical protein